MKKDVCRVFDIAYGDAGIVPRSPAWGLQRCLSKDMAVSHYVRSGLREKKDVCEVFDIAYGDAGIVPLPPEHYSQVWRLFYPIFLSEQEAMETKVKARAGDVLHCGEFRRSDWSCDKEPSTFESIDMVIVGYVLCGEE